MGEKAKWYPFDPYKGSRQKRPPIHKHVLIVLKHLDRCSPPRIVVGYRKDAAGDKQCPYFVRPGAGTPDDRPKKYDPAYTDVLAWCDCLPDNFEWPEIARGYRVEKEANDAT